MTTNDSFDQRLADWLGEDSAHRVPEHLDEVLELTRPMRQRAWWSSPERWLRMDTTFAGRLTPALRPAWLLILAALVLMAIVAVVAVVASRPRLPAPYGPAANGSIVYAADGDIYVADPDGQRARVLIGGPDVDVAARVSRDGTRLVIARVAPRDRLDLFVTDIDGSDLRLLTPAPLIALEWAEWSPDGKQVAVLHYVGGRPTLSILSTDGSPSIRDLALTGVRPEGPSLLPPDGREIVFRGVSHGGAAVYAVRADGGGMRTLARFVGHEGAYLGPRLSEDGMRLTYWHNQPADTPDGAKSEVHVLDLASGHDRRLAFDPTSRHELLPKFSPDGRSILLVRFGGTPDAATLQIIAADADASDLGRQIGPPQLWQDNIFEFSPDGTKVILTFDSNRRIQVIDVATGEVSYGDTGFYPSWIRLAP